MIPGKEPKKKLQTSQAKLNGHKAEKRRLKFRKQKEETNVWQRTDPGKKHIAEIWPKKKHELGTAIPDKEWCLRGRSHPTGDREQYSWCGQKGWILRTNILKRKKLAANWQRIEVSVFMDRLLHNSPLKHVLLPHVVFLVLARNRTAEPKVSPQLTASLPLSWQGLSTFGWLLMVCN